MSSSVEIGRQFCSGGDGPLKKAFPTLLSSSDHQKVVPPLFSPSPSPPTSSSSLRRRRRGFLLPPFQCCSFISVLAVNNKTKWCWHWPLDGIVEGTRRVGSWREEGRGGTAAGVGWAGMADVSCWGETVQDSRRRRMPVCRDFRQPTTHG
jgi:hypothetical protein